MSSGQRVKTKKRHSPCEPTHTLAKQLYRVVMRAWGEVIRDCVWLGFRVAADPKLDALVVRGQFQYHGLLETGAACSSTELPTQLNPQHVQTEAPVFDASATDDSLVLEELVAVSVRQAELRGRPTTEELSHEYRQRWLEFRAQKDERIEEWFLLIETLAYDATRLLSGARMDSLRPDQLRDRLNDLLTRVRNFTPPRPTRPSFAQVPDDVPRPANHATREEIADVLKDYREIRGSAESILRDILQLDATLVGLTSTRQKQRVPGPQRSVPAKPFIANEGRTAADKIKLYEDYKKSLMTKPEFIESRGLDDETLDDLEAGRMGFNRKKKG